MFALSHKEALVTETHNSLSAQAARPARLWAVRSASVAVASGIVAGAGFVCAHVLAAREPFGGTSGLLALYLTTIAVGVGLAVLRELVALANRMSVSLTQPAKIISITPPASTASEPNAQDWASRPFNAA